MKFLIVFCFCFNLFANDTFEIPPFNVSFNATNVMEKIQLAIKNPEGVLNRYTPVGGIVKNKKVDHSNVSFTMTKKVLVFTKTFFVHFNIDIVEDNSACKSGDTGYQFKLELQGSDALVTDNVDHLLFNICLNELNNSNASAQVLGKIFKGSNYSEPLGTIAKDTIQDQLAPFLRAISEEVKNTLY
jgi:hypothetical protein